MDLFHGIDSRPAFEQWGEVRLWRGALGDLSLDELVGEIPLAQSRAVMYGREIAVPRLECWFGSVPYRYGGQEQPPREMPETIKQIARRVGDFAGVEFDSCFANLYRDGSDCIAWHADDEAWIGPTIASLSLGATRRFCMKAKHDKRRQAPRREWSLGHGDLLVMLPGCQDLWLHRVPRTKAAVGPRLNLTFRQTVHAT